ncbi:hypothetical protein BsWGS_02437 [Bradybaena similaris]
MSEEQSNQTASNGRNIMKKILEKVMMSITASDVQSGEALQLLVRGFEAYNYSLSESELKNAEHFFRPVDLGPKREALSTVIPVTIIYCLIFITGFIGNVCTCLVIIRNKYMRTVTNYYLFNLSVSDLLLLLFGLPQETYTTWSAYPFLLGNAFCRLRLLVSEASCYVSILTITAFTVERYVAICHPIKFPMHSGLSRPLRVMLAVWVLSTLCAIPVGLQFGIVYKDWKKMPILESAQCNTLNADVSKVVFQVSTFIFFVLPMSVISLLYFFIALAIRRSTLNRAGSDSSNDGCHPLTACDGRQNSCTNHQARIRLSVLKMLVAVVVAFFLCWAPFHTQRLLVVYEQSWSPLVLTVHHVLYYVSGVTYYLSATINPILYSIMSLKFRQAFRSTLLCWCCCWTRGQPKRRANKNSYTFKFHPRHQLNTHCSVVESSSSTNNNGSSNNNKQASDTSNQSTPILCCVSGNEVPTLHVEGRPLVDMYACEVQRGPNYASNCVSQLNSVERML